MSKAKQSELFYQEKLNKFNSLQIDVQLEIINLLKESQNDDITEDSINECFKKLSELYQLAEYLDKYDITRVNNLKKNLNNLANKIYAKNYISLLEEKAELIVKLVKRIENNEDIDHAVVSNLYLELESNSERYNLLDNQHRDRADQILKSFSSFYNDYNARYNDEERSNMAYFPSFDLSFFENFFTQQPTNLMDLSAQGAMPPSNFVLQNLEEFPWNNFEENKEKQEDEEPLKGPSAFDLSLNDFAPNGSIHTNSPVPRECYAQELEINFKESQTSFNLDEDYIII